MTSHNHSDDELDRLFRRSEAHDDRALRAFVRRLAGARRLPSPEVRREHLSRIMAAVREDRATPSPIDLQTWRGRFGRAVAAATAKVLIGTTAAAAATGGLAATGRLPEPVEQVVEAAARSVGVRLPVRDDAPEEIEIVAEPSRPAQDEAAAAAAAPPPRERSSAPQAAAPATTPPAEEPPAAAPPEGPARIAEPGDRITPVECPTVAEPVTPTATAAPAPAAPSPTPTTGDDGNVPATSPSPSPIVTPAPPPTSNAAPAPSPSPSPTPRPAPSPTPGSSTGSCTLGPDPAIPPAPAPTPVEEPSAPAEEPAEAPAPTPTPSPTPTGVASPSGKGTER